MLHEALGRCPTPPGCDATYPETITNLHALHRQKETKLRLPPPTLGPFTLIQEIGKGAFSKVFLALNSNADPVALKVPTTTQSQDNEIQMLQAVVNLPHTAELLSFERFYVGKKSTPKETYMFAIAQRLYDGNLYAERFPKEFLPEKLRDLAVTLTAMWRKRISHLDVKPENIFWRHTSSSSVEAVLGDFGCATHFQTDEMLIRSSTKLGTFEFYPPEKRSEVITEIDAKGWDAFALGKSLEFLACDDEGVRRSQILLMDNDPKVRIDEVVRLASMDEGCVTAKKAFF
eukprot:GILI01002011.1.p1 GENE.GILI01002011.1~~GILI01002011.1.p1  ORF type:complete len:288 (+),score=27.68 GILI01002011.1:292-1155(+)